MPSLRGLGGRVNGHLETTYLPRTIPVEGDGDYPNPTANCGPDRRVHDRALDRCSDTLEIKLRYEGGV